MNFLFLTLGFAAGAVVAALVYESSLEKLARFLRERRSESNARVRLTLPTKGWRTLGAAMDEKLGDIQERSITEQRRQRTFGQDLAALGHDMRTPLTGAKGHLQLALRTAADEDTALGPEQLEHVNAAISRVDASVELLDKLSLYIYTNDPERSYSYERVALLPFLIEVLEGQAAALERKGWEPHIDFASEGLSIVADPTALRRILDNLITNALRYGAGAPSFVQTGQASAWELRISNRVAKPELIDTDSMFERFWRADKARTQAGLGLGLSAARQLAIDMEMSLHAELDGDTLTLVLGEGMQRG